MSMFEQILNTNLINFLIVISTLVWIFKKAKLGALIDKMSNDIKLSVEKSSIETKNAINEYKNIKKETANTPKLQEEIIANAKNNAKNLVDNIEQKALNTQQELENGLEKIYLAQNQKIKSMTVNEIYKACVDMAECEVKALLNPELHQKIINSSIEELDKIQGGLI